MRLGCGLCCYSVSMRSTSTLSSYWVRVPVMWGIRAWPAHDQRALGGQIGLAVHQVFLAVNQQVGDANLRCHGVPAAVQRQAAPSSVQS